MLIQKAFLVAAAVTMLSTALPAAASFYCSPHGSDSNPGTPDRPFATISRARDAVRVSDKPVTVYLGSGTYYQPETLVFDSRDSGTTYAALAGDSVTISGGRVITGFEPAMVNGKKMLVAQVPDVKDGKWNFTQLFINGRRRPRTRLPREGYNRIAGLDQLPKNYATRQDHFQFRPGDLCPDWAHRSDIDLVILHYWVSVRTGIKSIDDTANTARLTKASRRRLTSDFNTAVFARYYVENVFEALDTPGQWYLDREAGLLYYYPYIGEDTRNLQAVAPAMGQVVKVQGTPQDPVRELAFRNLGFAHCQYSLKPDDAGDVQAASYVPGAISLENAVNCSLSNCAVSQVGTYGVQIGAGCRNCRVENCGIHDLGAGGVKLEQGSEGSVVADNEIFDGGKIYPAAVGIWVGPSGSNSVVHNHVHDFDYTGISVGWKWDYGDSPAKNNRIEQNRIHDIGRGVLSDLGGIYCLGESPGTVLRNNLIYNCVSDTYGGWGIYTDQASSYIVIENNIVYNTKSGGFHQHWGKENVVRNNVFAFSRECQIRRSKDQPEQSFSFDNNIIYYETGNLLEGGWSDDHYEMDRNVYWNAASVPPAFAGESLEKWQARGHDRHSLITDPLFMNPKAHDFRLKPESPALKMGFKQIDVSGVGPRGPVGPIGD